MKKGIIIEYFGKAGEVLSKVVMREDLPQLAGTYCYWRPDECEAQQLQATGAKLKSRIGKVLKRNALLQPAR